MPADMQGHTHALVGARAVVTSPLAKGHKKAPLHPPRYPAQRPTTPAIDSVQVRLQLSAPNIVTT